MSARLAQVSWLLLFALLAGCRHAELRRAVTAAPANDTRELSAEARLRYYSERIARQPALSPLYTQLGLACLEPGTGDT